MINNKNKRIFKKNLRFIFVKIKSKICEAMSKSGKQTTLLQTWGYEGIVGSQGNHSEVSKISNDIFDDDDDDLLSAAMEESLKEHKKEQERRRLSEASVGSPSFLSNSIATTSSKALPGYQPRPSTSKARTSSPFRYC